MHQGRITPDEQAREVPPPADVCARIDLSAGAPIAAHGCFNSGVARMMTDRKEK